MAQETRAQEPDNQANERMISAAYKTFFGAMVHGGIEALARAAYELLGRPLAIGDETGASLLQYPAEEFASDNWMKLLNDGSINGEDFLKVHRDLKKGKLVYNEPVLVRGMFLSRKNQVVTIFKHHGETLTFATFLYLDDEPSENDMAIIRIFAEALRSELGRMQQFEAARGDQLAVVLNAQDKMAPEYLAAIKSLKKLFVGGFRVIVVEDVSEDGHSVLSRVNRSLKIGMFNCVSAFVEGKLCILVYGLLDGSKTIMQIANLLNEYHVSAALSTPFDAIERVGEYYFQACMTLSGGTRVYPDKKLYTYNECVPFQICAAAANSGPITVFVLPAVKEMAACDERTGSEWLKTTEAFLKNQLNKGNTAKELNIHSNTLAYRLKRLEERFGLDFESPASTTELYLSIVALKFVDKQ